MFLVNVYCLIRRKKMKKLLSVMLVLALCGIASAATVDFYITDSAGSDDITIEYGSDITLYLWYDGDDLSSFDIYAFCDITKDYEFTGGTITAINHDAAYDYVGLDSQTAIEMATMAQDLTTNPPVGKTLGKGVAQPLAQIAYSCLSTETVEITLGFMACAMTDWTAYNTDDSDVVNLNGMTITQPEPATIALLCLGGLLLRKKR